MLNNTLLVVRETLNRGSDYKIQLQNMSFDEVGYFMGPTPERLPAPTPNDFLSAANSDSSCLPLCPKRALKKMRKMCLVISYNVGSVCHFSHLNRGKLMIISINFAWIFPNVDAW